MKNLIFAFVVAFVFSTTAMAADIAISTQAGWFGQAAADREMQEIVDNVTAVTVEQFTADQQDALADWVVAHTGDGASDILILCGNFPDTIYPPGNAEPDGSLAELFLDDGNTIVNTGDYMFYVNSGGTNNNAAGGLQNMMDIAGITMWDDNTPVALTAEGHAIAPSLQDFQSDRPFHLDELEGDWYAELILAQNDAGTRADPVIVANAATGGRLGIFYQTAGQDDDPRGEVISEVINWFLTGGDVPNSSAWRPNPADGAIEVDALSLEWAAGNGAVSHKVYMSTDETIEESELVAETDLTIHLTALDPGMTYYWRVDEVDADGNVIEGKVWSFSTLALEAHFPNPADGATSQPLDAQLSWTAGKIVVMHDVYFGTDEAAVAARDPGTFKGKLITTSYDPGALDLETTYYWAVDQFTPTGTVAGPVWSFTTLGSVPITDPDLLLYYDFESGEGIAAIDQSGHSNHGLFMGTPEWATGLFGGALAIESADVDYIQTAGSLGITSNTITVAGWVKHDESPAAWSGILTTRGSGNLGLQHNGVELRYMWGADEYWWVETGLEIPNGEWYFAALTIAPDQGKLYLNGIEQTLTNVAEHVPVTFDSQIRVARDHNDDRIMTCLIDEVRLYNKTLTDVEILKLMGAVSDVTAPGDVVKGVPDDGDWPGAETPDLATDDDIGTKYLHFKGETEPTGFQIEPASGPSVVTGLTLTTANDATERDPISFELSGSNDSIDGPYTLIASGDIVDFAQETALPRFTMNATPISFDNDVAYSYYQVMFPAVRDPGSANSMQIAEVELLGVPAPIARWEFDGDFGGGTPVGDVSFEDDPDRGTVLSLPGGDNQYVDLGSVGISGNMPKTITVWAKADNTSIPDWTLIFGFTGNADGGGGNGSHFNIGSLGGPGGVGAHVWGWEETIFSDEEALEWHHYAMTYDGTTIQYYGDGVLMDTDPGKSNVRDLSASADRVHAGSRITQASSFPGKVDDARIYSQALSPLEISAIVKSAAPDGGAAELTAAFAFGSRLLDCATYNDPAVNYTMVHHNGDAPDAEAVEALQYDAARGYGYEVIYPVDSPFGNRSGYGVFGPFDDSPNNRSNFGDECPEELYDSFIGAKSFTNEVSAATMGDMDTPGDPPEGIIFRVDVPNGLYRFVGAFGEADNVHACRILAEDGGSGPPESISANHVVLVSNHDQAQQTIGEAEAAEPGEGVFARVGFDGLIPPLGDGVFPDPQFVDMDENGMPTDAGANSPILEVTQGYIRIHQLQGNSNDGPGGPRDANGGDIVILELWKVE